MSDRWLKMRAVQELTSYSRSTIYRLMVKAGFPRPRRLGVAGRVVWSEREVRAWMEAQEGSSA